MSQQQTRKAYYSEPDFPSSSPSHARKHLIVRRRPFPQPLTAQLPSAPLDSSIALYQHRQSILKHSRLKSFQVSEFKQRLKCEMRQKLQQQQQRLRTQTQLNQRARATRDFRLRQMKLTIQNFKNAEAQHYRYSLNERKRRTLENQKSEKERRMRKGRQQSHQIYCYGQRNVETMYLNKQENERKKGVSRLTRIERLLRLRNNLEHHPHSLMF